MSLNRYRVVLEVETLEDRNAPAAISPGPAAVVLPSQTPGQANSATFSPLATTVLSQNQNGSPSLTVASNQSGFTTPTTSGLALLPLSGTPAPQSSIQSLLGLTAALPGQFSPTVTSDGLAPTLTGAGAAPLNNSIPNAAGTLSAGAGLNSLSPFLPAYYIGYTQTGPFYTGGEAATAAAVVPQSSSLYPTNAVPSTTDGTGDGGAAAALPSTVDPMLGALSTLSLHRP
jgi:hypothetical protein